MVRFFFGCLALGVAGAATVGLWPEHSTEFELANGMKFVVLERPSSSSVSITLLAKAGWADDPVDRKGLTRVMERMVEEGGYAFGAKNPAEERKAMANAEQLADKWENELAKPKADELDTARFRVDAEGAAAMVTTLSEPAALRTRLERAGGVMLRSKADATTTAIVTAMPTAEAATWFEGMGAWLRDPAWRNFYRHRAEAANGIQTIDEQTALLNTLAYQAFPKHAWGAADGNIPDMQKLRVRDLAAFHKVAFAPGNLVVSIAGNLPAATVRALAEKHLAALAPQPAMKHAWAQQEIRPWVAPPARAGAQILALGYPRSSIDSPDDSVLDVVSFLLFNGQDSYLNAKLVKTLRAATITGLPSYPSTSGGGLLTILAAPVPGRPLTDLENDIQAAIDDLAAHPVSAVELLPGKRRYIASMVRLMEEDDTASEVLARSAAAYGSAKDLAKIFAQLEAVTPADVARAARQYLKPGARVSVSWIGGRR